MATRNYVPRANGEGSIGTEKKHWGGAFFDKLAVKTLEVIGGGTENDAQPATVGWVREHLKNGLKEALSAIGVSFVLGEGASYISFGAAFGGLLIQRGSSTTLNTNGKDIIFPLAHSKPNHHVVLAIIPDAPKETKLRIYNADGSKFTTYHDCNAERFHITWVSIGFV